MEQRVSTDGSKWYWPIYDTKCWEDLHAWHDVPDIIMQHVDTKNVIVQAGGNCGLYVKKYAQQFNRVYTFEPVNELFKCLVLNVPEDNVIKFQACLGDTHSLVSMNEHETKNIGGYHVGSNSGFIPTIKIDDLNLDDCSLIHLDIEGYELFALKGAICTINKYKPIIVIEHCEKWLNRYCTSIKDIDEFLSSLKYEYTCSARGDRIYKFC